MLELIVSICCWLVHCFFLLLLLLLLLFFFFFSRNFLDKKFTQLFSLQFRIVAKYELNCFPALYLITLNDYGSSEKWNSVIQREN